MKINPSCHWARTNAKLKCWDGATDQGVVRGKPVVVVKDLSTEKQLLTTNRKTLSGLNLFFQVSDRLIWVHQQRMRPTIQTTEDEERQIRSHVPHHMEDCPVQNAKVRQAGNIGSE